ncbi:PspC domain-containing protein [Microbacterium sp. HJ5]
MTDSTAAQDAAPLADPGPPPPPPAGRPGGWDRFFAWMSDLGIARGDGWIGGVCAGLAARIGIDPIIVRGVFVVAAMFGLPMFIVYAVAWAVLPDLIGRIHLRELIARRFDPAMVGIGLMLVIGFFPVVPWFFAAALPFGPFGSDWSPWGFFWTLFAVAVIGGIIYLVARSAPRAPSSGASPVTDPRTASAAPAGSGEIAHDVSGVGATADPATDDSAPSAAGSALTPASVEPPAPLGGATDADLATWREQHAEWKRHDHAWRRQQQDAERAARDRARAERAAAAGTFAVEAAEQRRIRRLSNPRTSFGYVVFVLGAALIVGAITSLWRGAAEPGEPVLAVAFGLFAAALVAAVSMVVAGAFRRRSGFLAFLTIALLVAGTSTAAVPVSRGVVFGDAYVNTFEPRSFTQVWGNLVIDVADVGTGSDVEAIRIDKRGGPTEIYVGQDVVLTLQVTSEDGVDWSTFDPANGETVEGGTWQGNAVDGGRMLVRQRIDTTTSDADEPPTRQTVILDQQSGSVSISIYEP